MSKSTYKAQAGQVEQEGAEDELSNRLLVGIVVECRITQLDTQAC